MRPGRRGFWTCAVLLVLSLAGCPDDAPPAEVPDAAPPDSLCPLPEGQSYFMTGVEVTPSTQGFDLDGDGDIDNMLGNLPAVMLQQIKDAMTASIEGNEALVAFHIIDWTVPPTANDAEVAMAAVAVRDSDHDPSDNASGQEEFWARLDLEQFDLDCNLKTWSDTAAFVDGTLVAHIPDWSVLLTTGTGTLQVLDIQLAWPFSGDFRTFSGELGGTAPLCTLSATPFPGSTSTVLEAIVNDPTIAAVVTIDMDLDGDGLEQVVGDGDAVVYCVDGDGTRIDGRACPCHPDIADGISTGWIFSGVTARIIGTQ